MGSRARQDKYIDLSQFIYNKQGHISWKDSVGIIAEFFYNGERHAIQIIKYNDYRNIDIKVDDIIINNVEGKSIKGLKFERLFYTPHYFYNVGDVVNNLLIIKQVQIPNKNSGYKNKGYICKCLNDGCVLEKEEDLLRRGYGCPVCDNKIVVRGINDVGTTHPELVCYFANIDDAYTHTIGSNDIVSVKCKCCGNIDNITVFELNRRGNFICDNCSDNVSYPNKFAHELFRQLKSQYLKYISEYSPKWADKCRYDNYIKLLDGNEIIVEMDGAFHYEKYEKYNSRNDKKKDFLANNNEISMIRIDCNYDRPCNRFDYIKSNIIKMLSEYFDLSDIDWGLCDKIGMSSMIENVVEYFNEHTDCTIKNISEYFNLSMSTVYQYLQIGNKIGICNYTKYDPNRNKHKSLAISVSGVNGEFIGNFKSIQQFIKKFPEKNLHYSSIKNNVGKNKPYKGYVFNPVINN